MALYLDGSSLTALPDGTLIIEGLISNGSTFKDYEFLCKSKKIGLKTLKYVKFQGF